VSSARFTDGRRLYAQDLRDEGATRDTDRIEHLGRSHPDDGAVGRGSAVVAADRSCSLATDVTPAGPVTTVAIGDEVHLRLGSNSRFLRGSLVVSEGGAYIAGSVRLAPSPPRKEPQPFSLVAVKVAPDDGKPGRHELRLGLSDDSAADPTSQRAGVGTFAVAADGTSTAGGNIEVAGVLTEGDVPPDPDDPRFLHALDRAVAETILQSPLGGVLQVNVAVGPLANGGTESQVDVTMSTNTQVPMRWGLAIEAERGADRHALLADVGDASLKSPLISTITMRWSPPLSANEAFNVVFAVAAVGIDRSLRCNRQQILFQVPA
jgi:hypothetical protein